MITLCEKKSIIRNKNNEETKNKMKLGKEEGIYSDSDSLLKIQISWSFKGSVLYPTRYIGGLEITRSRFWLAFHKILGTAPPLHPLTGPYKAGPCILSALSSTYAGAMLDKAL